MREREDTSCVKDRQWREMGEQIARHRDDGELLRPIRV
jgi:hypothetical protein